MADNRRHPLLVMTAEIVASHVSNNHVALAELPRLINDVYRSLSETDAGRPPGKIPEPAVALKKSVGPDHIVCLEDGHRFKSMKRHLKTSHGMTPDEYRQKWKLAFDYPMVAPAYAKHRSSLAKKLGLGMKRAGRKKK